MEDIKFKVNVKELDGSITTADMTIDSENDVTAEMGTTPSGKEVIANPTGDATTELEKLQVAGTIYSVGGGSNTTYQPFNQSWTVNSTTAALCEDILADNEAVPAMAYMGEVSLSDMPLNGNAELIVEIMEGPASGVGKAIHLILTSGTDSPYRWEYTYWKISGTAHNSGWIGFQPYGAGIPYLTTAPSSANLDGIKFVVLNAEPANKYDGYLYIIND